MEVVTKFILTTVLLTTSGDMSVDSLILAKCPVTAQYYEYMEKRVKDKSENLADWRAACVQVDFVKKDKAT